MSYNSKEIMIKVILLTQSNKLVEITECNICSETFKQTTITKCGHTFCGKCISECINLHNNCPTCKKDLTENDLIRNYLLDDVIQELMQQRDENCMESLKKNFNNSPIESLFIDSLKGIFSSYENFHSHMEDKYFKMKQQAEKENDLEKLSVIKKQEQESKIAIMDSLKLYLKQIPDSPFVLPIKTKIIIEKTNTVIPNVTIMRHESVEDLYKLVKLYFTNIGNPIADFKDSVFRIKRQILDKDINDQMFESVSYIDLRKDQMMMSTDIVSGEEIFLVGDFTRKSDVPKDCVTFNFAGSLTTDYFSCSDCAINWICNECRENCHAGHSLTLFKANHTSQWACCYCVKKNCQLRNKNTKV